MDITVKNKLIDSLALCIVAKELTKTEEINKKCQLQLELLDYKNLARSSFKCESFLNNSEQEIDYEVSLDIFLDSYESSWKKYEEYYPLWINFSETSEQEQNCYSKWYYYLVKYDLIGVILSYIKIFNSHFRKNDQSRVEKKDTVYGDKYIHSVKQSTLKSYVRYLASKYKIKDFKTPDNVLESKNSIVKFFEEHGVSEVDIFKLKEVYAQNYNVGNPFVGDDDNDETLLDLCKDSDATKRFENIEHLDQIIYTIKKISEDLSTAGKKYLKYYLSRRFVEENVELSMEFTEAIVDYIDKDFIKAYIDEQETMGDDFDSDGFLADYLGIARETLQKGISEISKRFELI